jgi:integrase
MERNEIVHSRRYTPEKAAKEFATYGPAGDPDDIQGSRAIRTECQYGSAWRIYTRWCDAEGLTPMPADAQQLLRYLRHLRARNLTPATAEAYIGAVAAIHRINGFAIDRTAIVEPMKAFRRKQGTQRRAKPLLARMLKDLVGRLDNDTRVQTVRDKLILLLAFGMAGRSAEVVGLDWQRPGSLLTGTTGYVTAEDDGLAVTLLSSKAAQITSTEVFISDREMPSLRPALMRWIELAGVQPGMPLFPATIGRHITSRRLAPESVAHIVRKRVEAYSVATGKRPKEARLLAKEFSAHSIRRGLCTSLSRARVPFADIRRRSRHRSDAMVARYVADAEGRRSGGLGKVGF